jgi:hypothetical protein
MIVLDTHIWVWWVQNDSRLTAQHRQWLKDYERESDVFKDFQKLNYSILRAKINMRFFLPLLSLATEYLFTWKSLIPRLLISDEAPTLGVYRYYYIHQ